MSGENSTSTGTQKSYGPGYIEVIILALLLSSAVVVAYDRILAQKIKVVDLKGYLRIQKTLLAAGEITEQQWKSRLDTIENLLDHEALNNPQHVIIMKDVVLRNGDEIHIK